MADSVARQGPLELRWLVRLRWAAVAAQAVSLVGVKYLLRAPFPLAPLLGIVASLALVNLALWRQLTRGATLTDRAVALNLLLDILGLTALLVWTGGAMNPFTTLYLLEVALAAILVPRRWSLVVAVAAVVAFGGLLLARPEAIHVWHSAGMFLLHVRGMWLAFALTAGCLWYFVDRVSASLRERELELSRARVENERATRLVALGTLAAGTAHELNTPLGTVAILASELADLVASDPVASDHARMIRAEVRRCAKILARMRPHDQPPEPAEARPIGPWVAEVVASWCERRGESPAVPVQLEASVATVRVTLHAEALTQSLHALLDNASLAVEDAPSPPEGEAPIEVRVSRPSPGEVALVVRDRGVGIPAEHLPRLGEPFFTTREPGEGMGLGLFLVQATASLHRGSLTVESVPGDTRVTLTLPTG